MPSIELSFLAPIEPSSLTLLNADKFSQRLTTLIWDIGTLNITSNVLYASNNINGHVIGHTPIADEQLITSPSVGGNTYEFPFLPLGRPTYLTLKYKSGGVNGFLQILVQSPPLVIESPNSGTISNNESLFVSWSDSGDNQSYTLEVLDETLTTVFYTNTVTGSAVLVPANVIRTISNGSNYVLRVTYLSGTLAGTQATKVIGTKGVLDDVFNFQYSSWQALSETYTYPTYINTYEDGTSNRYSANPSFIHEVNLTVPITQQESLGLLHLMKDKGEDVVLVPLWHRAAYVKNLSGSTYEICGNSSGLDYPLYTSIPSLIYRSSDSFIVETITAVSATHVTISTAGFQAIAIVPLYDAHISYKEGNLHSSGYYEGRFTFRMIPRFADSSIYATWHKVYPSWYVDSSKLWTYVPNRASLSVVDKKLDMSSKTTKDHLITGLEPIIKLSYTLPLIGIAEIGSMLYLLSKLRGPQNSFFHILPASIFNIVTINSSFLRVRRYGVVTEELNGVIKYIVYDGEMRPVDSIVDQGVDIIYNFQTPFSTTPSKDLIFPAIHARLANETLGITYLSGELAEANIDIIEIL
jgi:hypothetical protein